MQTKRAQWDAGKQAHKELSDAAAPIYDSVYADANYATNQYMAKEERTIRDVSMRVADKSVALDLGCGTGRDSIILAKNFQQVFGYDFSKGMVAEAQSRRLRGRHGNVAYKLLDIEIEGLPHNDASVDLANTGFGMGSFIRDLSKLLREVRRVLKPQGYAIFSFYNRNSLVRRLPLEWESSLAAILHPDRDVLTVTLPDQSRYEPSAKMYSVAEVESELSQYFDLVQLETYPTLSALMPNTLFKNPLAGELCAEVDRALAGNLDIAGGHYIIAVCQKAGKLTKRRPLEGYERAYELIRREGLTGDIVRHAPVKNMQNAETALRDHNVTADQMLKSVLIAKKIPRGETINPLRPPEMWQFVMQSERRLDFAKIAKLLGVSRANLELAKLSVLEDFTGFTVGAIPPFAMPKAIPVVFDSPIGTLSVAWCGTGDPSQSIRVPVRILEKMSTCSYADISK